MRTELYLRSGLKYSDETSTKEGANTYHYGNRAYKAEIAIFVYKYGQLPHPLAFFQFFFYTLHYLISISNSNQTPTWHIKKQADQQKTYEIQTQSSWA